MSVCLSELTQDFLLQVELCVFFIPGFSVEFSSTNTPSLGFFNEVISKSGELALDKQKKIHAKAELLKELEQ